MSTHKASPAGIGGVRSCRETISIDARNRASAPDRRTAGCARARRRCTLDKNDAADTGRRCFVCAHSGFHLQKYRTSRGRSRQRSLTSMRAGSRRSFARIARMAEPTPTRHACETHDPEQRLQARGRSGTTNRPPRITCRGAPHLAAEEIPAETVVSFDGTGRRATSRASRRCPTVWRRARRRLSPGRAAADDERVPGRPRDRPRERGHSGRRRHA